MANRSVWAVCLLLTAVGSAAAEDNQPVSVLVAKRKIAAFTFVKDVKAYFEIQEKPRIDVPKNALLHLDDKDLEDGFRVSRTIAEGGYLTRDDLINKELGDLAEKLPPGMRAITTRVSADSLVGGFVLPGSKVDVLWTYRSKTGQAGTRTILQNVLVVAINDNGHPHSVKLAVKPEDAQLLSLAAANGEIRLTLRNPSDTEKIPLKETKLQDLAEPLAEPQKENKIPDLPHFPKEKDASETIKVLVAKKKISAMTCIKNADEYFRVEEKRKVDVPGSVLTDLNHKAIQGGFRVARGRLPREIF